MWGETACHTPVKFPQLTWRALPSLQIPLTKIEIPLKDKDNYNDNLKKATSGLVWGEVLTKRQPTHCISEPEASPASGPGAVRGFHILRKGHIMIHDVNSLGDIFEWPCKQMPRFIDCIMYNLSNKTLTINVSPGIRVRGPPCRHGTFVKYSIWPKPKNLEDITFLHC